MINSNATSWIPLARMAKVFEARHSEEHLAQAALWPPRGPPLLLLFFAHREQRATACFIMAQVRRNPTKRLMRRICDSDVHYWREFKQQVDLDGSDCMVLLDFNGVVNTCDERQALFVAGSLDHFNTFHTSVPSLLCSHPGQRPLDPYFEPRADWHALIKGLDGYVFVYNRWCHREVIEAWRPEGMPDNVICIDGDKNAMSCLTQKPSILFDDRQDLVTRHDEGHLRNEGVVVPGRKFRSEDVTDWHYYSSDPWKWPQLAWEFADRNNAWANDRPTCPVETDWVERFFA